MSRGHDRNSRLILFFRRSTAVLDLLWLSYHCSSVMFALVKVLKILNPILLFLVECTSSYSSTKNRRKIFRIPIVPSSNLVFSRWGRVNIHTSWRVIRMCRKKYRRSKWSVVNRVQQKVALDATFAKLDWIQPSGVNSAL